MTETEYYKYIGSAPEKHDVDLASNKEVGDALIIVGYKRKAARRLNCKGSQHLVDSVRI